MKHRDGFYNMPLAMEANIPSHEWCNFMGSKGTHLAPFHCAKGFRVSIFLCMTTPRINLVYLGQIFGIHIDYCTVGARESGLGFGCTVCNKDVCPKFLTNWLTWI